MKMKDSMDQMEFDRGNPQEDAPRRVQKRKKLNWKPVWFAVAAAVLAAVLLVASLTDTTAFDGLRRSITYARAKKDETGCAQLYHYAADRTSCFASLDGSLAIVTNSQLLGMQENGQVVCNETVKWTSCTVAQNQGIAAAYDIGGTTLCVADFKGNKTDIEPAGEIISADLSDSGYLAVCSDAAGYKGAVTVYDTSGKAVYVWYSGTGYLVRAAVSPDGKYLAALCLQDSGSVVHTFALTSEDERGSAACADELFADLFWRGGKVCCVSQTRLAFFDDNAKLTAEYPFGDLYLYDYAAEGDGFVTLALSRYRSGSAEQLVTVNASGSELGKCETTGAVTSLSVNGKQVLVQYSDRLTLYNQQLDEIKSVEQNLLGVRRSVLLRRGAALLLSGSSAEVLAF